MPTPESEAFLAKKPKVPPTFDGVDYDDTKRLKQAQDAIIREQWVQVMMGRLVREELSKCYYREGVNHLEKCGRLRGQSAPVERREAREQRLWDTGSLQRLFGNGQVRRILTSIQNATSNCSQTPRSRVTSSSSRTTSRRTARSNKPSCLEMHGWAFRTGHKFMKEKCV
jgi:hypothetical protein